MNGWDVSGDRIGRIGLIESGEWTLRDIWHGLLSRLRLNE